jgi:23S rRNA pseudouridine2605 synthase
MTPPTKKSFRPRRKAQGSSWPRRTGSKTDSPGAPERAQKVLARLGVGSRREVEEWIRVGRLSVNGVVATLGVRVGPEDQLRLDGRLIRQRGESQATVLLCHRSPGESLSDLIARIPRSAGRRFVAVSPMPRIDGGLEIVTSDGELASRLQRSAHRLSSEFSVRVRGELPEQALRGVLDGILDSGARLNVESCEAGGGEGANRWYTLVESGGSGKDVRQLFERQGAIVSRVLRTTLGSVELSRDFPRGRFRELSADEISGLLPHHPPSH